MKKENVVLTVLVGALVLSLVGFVGLSDAYASNAPSFFDLCHVKIMDGLPVFEQSLRLPFSAVIGNHFESLQWIPSLGHEFDYIGECVGQFAAIVK